MASAFFVVTLAAFASFSSAIPTPSTLLLHEKRSSIPRLWTRGDRVERDAILPVRIGLTQQNIDSGYVHLMDVWVNLKSFHAPPCFRVSFELSFRVLVFPVPRSLAKNFKVPIQSLQISESIGQQSRFMTCTRRQRILFKQSEIGLLRLESMASL